MEPTNTTIPKHPLFDEKTLDSITNPPTFFRLFASPVQVAHLTFSAKDQDRAKEIASSLGESVDATTKLTHILAEKVIQVAKGVKASFKDDRSALPFTWRIGNLTRNSEVKHLFEADRATSIFNKYLVEAFIAENSSESGVKPQLSTLSKVTGLGEDVLRSLIAITAMEKALQEESKVSFAAAVQEMKGYDSIVCEEGTVYDDFLDLIAEEGIEEGKAITEVLELNDFTRKSEITQALELFKRKSQT